VEFRNDATGIVHARVGKLSFDQAKLLENARAFIDHILAMKPNAVKGTYVKSISVKATMTPGIRVLA
jgi:large subunit ribosomal protein L1